MAAPLDRTWFNTLIDDDGSGALGTVWNKAQIDGLLDTIDGSLAGLVDKSGAPAANAMAVFSDPDTVVGSALRLAGHQILQGTSAGADNGAVVVSGAGSVDQTRGAFIGINGNQTALVPGGIQLILGSAPDSNLYIQRAPGGIVVFGVRGSDGLVTLYSGQLQFPGTQNPSTHATTLDDYREGTWTPTLGGLGGQSGQVYTLRSGSWIKVGRQVFVQGRVICSVVGTISGQVTIIGLPVSAGGGDQGFLTLPFFGGMAIAVTALSGSIAPGANYASLWFIPGAGNTGMSPLAQAQLSGSIDFMFAGSYMAAT